MKANRKEYFWLVLIILLAAVLRFWNLAGLELSSDGGHYAFRALGWFDFLGGSSQTTPFQWFGAIPVWANLSFHDAPPLNFLLQKISFSFLGETVFAALLPGVIAGLAALVFIYLAVRQALGAPWARLAALVYAFSSYAVWVSRTGYLEAVETAFLAGSFYFFFKYVASSESKNLYWWGAFTGLSLLTKYTALFFLPAVAVFILWRNRATLKKPDFWMGVFLLLLVLTPLIVYNAMVFATRGHFDAALSSMFGMQPEDFKLIAGRTTDAGWWVSAKGVSAVLRANISPPLFWLFMASLVWLALAAVFKKANDFSRLVLLSALFMWVMFGFSGSTDRYLAIAVPFLVMSAAAALYELWRVLPKPPWRFAGGVILFAALAVEVFYGVQTNLLPKPAFAAASLFSSSRFYNRGFAELDKFLAETFKTNKRRFARKENIREIAGMTLRYPAVVFFDTRADWFSSMWHISRHSLYYDAPILNFHPVWQDEKGNPIDTFKQFKRFGLPEMLLVVARGESRAYSGGEAYDKAMDDLTGRISTAGIAPVKVINDYQGRPGFEIYRLTPADLK